MDFIVGGSGIIVVGIFIDAAIVVAVVVAIVVAIVVVVDAFVQTWSMWYHQGRWVLINSI